MEIQALPYIAPEPGLTANSAPQNLKDHYLAFVARHTALADGSEEAQNSCIHEFNEITDQTPLVDILVYASQQESVTDKQMDKLRMFVRIQIKKAGLQEVIGRQDQFKLIHVAMGWINGGCYRKNGIWMRNMHLGRLEKRNGIFKT